MNYISHRLRTTTSFLLLGVSLGVTRAEVRLPGLFSDNMVLQQGMKVPVWGWANDGEAITVSFLNRTASTVARDGKWRVNLSRLEARSVGMFTVSTKTQTIQYTNVLVGDVWICSGQSNMEFPLSRSYASADDIAAATNGLIRLFLVPKLKAEAPVADVKARWELCTPESAARFSAVGYYFGRALHPVTQRSFPSPVGLIGTYWGGSPAEVWMSHQALAADSRYQAEILAPADKAQQSLRRAVADFEKEKAAAEAAGTPFTKRPPRASWIPSELYNGMIAPLQPYAIQGAIWYQGEANAGRAEQYRSLFPDMIRNWRSAWGRDFTFLCVQLAPYKVIQAQPGESDWAELREAQLLATKVLPKVGMAVITDVGDEKDIHPTKKQPVGERLALAARAIAGAEKIPFSGPLYRSMKRQDGHIVLTFEHAGDGLVAKDGDLKGFTICGEDRKWVWATAKIQTKDTIIVNSPEVPQPVAVRFGWADYPVVNLWNQDGLPATPFRTDDFPLITAKKK
jgi:sialate O-acetylesterase